MSRRSLGSILLALCLTLALSASLAPGAMADGAICRDAVPLLRLGDGECGGLLLL